MTETERHVRLFRNGRNQALRIPREFELEGMRWISEGASSQTLVTSNAREFARVPSLGVENWLPE